MNLAVGRPGLGHRLLGEGPVTELGNRYLTHLEARGFSAGTVRGYAFDLLSFNRFLAERDASLNDVIPMDFFDWLDWQARPAAGESTGKVIRLADRKDALG